VSDRKYRHRGYMDDDRDDEPRQRRGPSPSGPSRMEGAPRGRGVGLPQDVVFNCANCGKKVETIGVIEVDATCSFCGSPLHSCSNCTFFDPGSRFECRKTLPARVESKTKVNDCRHFQPKAVRDLSARTPHGPDDPRAAFDALFKK